MWNALTEIVPAPVLFGSATLVLFAYLAAPEAGRRMAIRDAFPNCIAGVERQAAVSGLSQRDMGATLLDLMANQLPGSDLGRGARGLAGVLRGARRHSTSPDARSVCRCLLEATVRDGEVRRDITIHLLSLRIIAESGVTDIAGNMARKRREGHCSTEAGP